MFSQAAQEENQVAERAKNLNGLRFQALKTFRDLRITRTCQAATGI